MTMITQEYSLDLVPGGQKLVVNVSQYDKEGRLLVFNLYQAGLAYSIPAGTGATIKGTKPDSKGFDYAMTVSATSVSLDIPQQMTAVAGDTTCEIMLTDTSGNTIATTNFILCVEKAAMDDNTVISDSDIPVFEGLVAQATQQAANASASASASAVSASQADADVQSVKAIMPASTGSIGQVLTKTASGADWKSPAYTTISIAVADWSSSTTTVDGIAYYTTIKSVTAVYDEEPVISLKPAGTLPTSAESSAYACLDQAYCDTSAKNITFYATVKPSTAFSVDVKGVA